MPNNFKKLDCRLYRHLFDDVPDSDDFYGEHLTLARIELNARTLLPYSQRCNPNLTLHNAEHSARVIDNINTLIDIIKENGGTLSDTEVELLYYSAWYHDIGLLLAANTYDPKNKDKEKHGRVSVNILRSHPELTEMSDEMNEALYTIIESHNYGLDNADEIITINGENIRLRMLCSMLCLSDLCDYNVERAQKIVYDILKDELTEEENDHWIANRSVDIEINKTYRMIIVSKLKDVNCDVILDGFRKYAQMHIDNIDGLDLRIEYIDKDE